MMRLAAPLVLLVLLLARAAGAESPRLADERILLRTNRGDLVLALYPDVAPRHVAQLLALVRLGVYDSSWFYRVDPSFVAQLTDAANRLAPLTPEQQAALHPIPAEFSPALTHQRGTLSMARRDDDPNSAESSFSILLQPAPHLDGKYTIFGELERGGAVLDAIASARRDAGAPAERVVVEHAFVLPAADIALLAEHGQLMGPIAEPTADRAVPAAAEPPRVSLVIPIGVAMMIVTSGAAFLGAGRWPPQRSAAFALLTVLIGAFLLLRELAPRAAGHPLLASALFFGLVGVFKLMNRFEAATRA